MVLFLRSKKTKKKKKAPLAEALLGRVCSPCSRQKHDARPSWPPHKDAEI